MSFGWGFISSGYAVATALPKIITCRKSHFVNSQRNRTFFALQPFCFHKEETVSWSIDHFCMWRLVKGKISPTTHIPGLKKIKDSGIYLVCATTCIFSVFGLNGAEVEDKMPKQCPDRYMAGTSMSMS